MTKEEECAKQWQIGRAVLRYLQGDPKPRSHPEAEGHPDARGRPEAKDTLEGIARWWLELERSERLLRDVEQAVALLLSHNLILETRRLGIPPYYKLNPEQRKAIDKILEDA